MRSKIRTPWCHTIWPSDPIQKDITIGVHEVANWCSPCRHCPGAAITPDCAYWSWRHSNDDPQGQPEEGRWLLQIEILDISINLDKVQVPNKVDGESHNILIELTHPEKSITYFLFLPHLLRPFSFPSYLVNPRYSQKISKDDRWNIQLRPINRKPAGCKKSIVFLL